MLWKCCTQHASKFGKLSSGYRTGKGQFSFQSKERQCQRSSNYHTITLISHASKVMLKILQTRLQQYVNHELPNVQAGFRRGRGTRDQISNICWIIKKAREFQEDISVQFSQSVVSDSLWPHELQHARPPHTSPSPGVHSNSHPSRKTFTSALLTWPKPLNAGSQKLENS